MSVLLDLRVSGVNYLNETALFKNAHLNWILPISPILHQICEIWVHFSAILKTQASCLKCIHFRVWYIARMWLVEGVGWVVRKCGLPDGFFACEDVTCERLVTCEEVWISLTGWYIARMWLVEVVGEFWGMVDSGLCAELIPNCLIHFRSLTISHQSLTTSKTWRFTVHTIQYNN